jgi:hypothetical protein
MIPASWRRSVKRSGSLFGNPGFDQRDARLPIPLSKRRRVGEPSISEGVVHTTPAKPSAAVGVHTCSPFSWRMGKIVWDC